MTTTKNFRVTFAKRPGVNGEPSEDNFRYEECDYPAVSSDDPEDVIVKTLYLSIDPAMRCRLNEDSGVDYMKGFQLGDTIQGFGGIGVVVQSSQNSSLQEGDMVLSQFGWPWMLYFNTKMAGFEVNLTKIDRAQCGDKPTLFLSALGLTSGITSYLGVKEKGNIKPGTNQTMVVSGAAGACGSLAGQIGRLEGCGRVIGICGSDEKCNYLTSELGFDGAVNYKTEDVDKRLHELCPDGVDVYFDNVGGEISNTVIRQMNKDSHVILCGQIAVYNQDLPYPPPIPDDIKDILTAKNITRERYLVLNYPDKFDTSVQQLMEWILQGKLKVRETVIDGLENAGTAFVSMMKGGNIGKQIVHVSEN